jgi:ribosomal protein S4
LESVANLDASLRGESNKIPTPIPLQTYAELEKRLDFALFRAMFASSIRQARQFILHGYVSVNGIRIRQPGFHLDSGDVFHVVPEKVLLALGATKPPLKKSIQVDNYQIKKWNEYVSKARKNPKQVWDEQQLKRQSGGKGGLDEVETEALEQRINNFNKNIEAAMLKEQKSFTRNAALLMTLKLGLEEEEATFETFRKRLSKDASEKALKLFQKTTSLPAYSIETLKSKSEEELTSTISSIIDKDAQSKRKDDDKKSHSEIKQLIASLQSIHWEDLRKASSSKHLSKDSTSIPYDANWASSLIYHDMIKKDEVLTHGEHKASVNLPWQKGLFGRQEVKKPYFTPWKVRPFIAPFAILPSHIEVSFETCHAVYLRDPVALPGKSEVITPFNQSVHERAYMWYIRRVKTSKQ